MYIKVFTCVEYLTAIHITENKDCILNDSCNVQYVKMA